MKRRVLVAILAVVVCIGMFAGLGQRPVQAAGPSFVAQIPKGFGPDYTAFEKNGYKPVVTPVNKMTPSTTGFATEISPPIQQVNCVTPPVGFNPLIATSAQLLQIWHPLALCW